MTLTGADEQRVRAAMAAHPRDRFLPRSQRRRAGYDGPLTIGHGQTNSQPRTVAQMLVLLDVRAGDAVLDVGSGSGWSTALLAALTGPTGTVLGVERLRDLVEMGRANLRRAGVPWARISVSEPGVLGAPGHAPFDRVLVSAMAARFPEALLAQVRTGGILVAPVAGTMLRVVRDPTASGGRRVTEHGAYRFVPLVED